MSTFWTKDLARAVIEPKVQAQYLIDRGRGITQIPTLGVIMLYQPHIMRAIELKYELKTVEHFKPQLKILETNSGTIGVCSDFGFGAPSTVVLFELLIAFGCKKFFTIGSAGAIQKNLKTGDLIICTEAIRDEGVSFHYLSPEEEVLPSPDLVKALQLKLEAKQIKFYSGMSWTTDAPFRETIEEFEMYEEQGALCVEMEAAALYAVAKARGVEVASAFCVSDLLSKESWTPAFHHRAATVGQLSLFEVCVEALMAQ